MAGSIVTFFTFEVVDTFWLDSVDPILTGIVARRTVLLGRHPSPRGLDHVARLGHFLLAAHGL